MTHHDTPHTPRTDAEHFIDRARTTTHLVDLPGIGEVATAAAILDLADAIRETGQPTVDYAEAGHETDHRYDCGVTIEVDDDDDDAGPPAPRCPAEGCGRVDGHEGVHLVADPITLPPITMKRGGIRYDAPAVVCGAPGLNGTCRREPGHGGLHDSETIEVLADAVVDTDGPQAGQWLVVRTTSDYRSRVIGPFRTADQSHQWADDNDKDPGIAWSVVPLEDPAR
ncbi:hypothetical protein SEA_VERITY_59 [Gordonia phage Verity]|uniref:Uncharacterized protein n=1 Tax=Gordonia phage Verity TaxID=2591211 RepID=A0A514DIX8_9CAUD|nr:hypothetical protein J1776_gp59 [Gordonia phage Verity]QDH93545.1 hypothetical protein SEA_VERITY_59 [Gordonia phage Verity]QPO16902.1 hypothetical protein SEA_DELREY21_59 [Gordonia phage Delrey21]QXN74185.1 hypothetical protein SEA_DOCTORFROGGO_59 [Gordonia phage DoctorFroggo]